MGGGGSGGMGGGGPVAIREWTAVGPGAGNPPTYSFPDNWLQITCPTDQRTSQTSANSLQTGYGPNAARPRNVGLGWGLSVESARRNEIVTSDSWSGMGWSMPGGAMMSSPSHPDPAGGMLAIRFDSAGNQTSSVASGVTTGYASSWLKGNGIMGPFAYFVVGDAVMNWSVATVDDGTKWKRYEVGEAAGYYRLETRGDADGDPPAIPAATSIFAYGAQYESLADGKTVHYPSSYIPTMGAVRTREADILFSNSATTLLPNGYWNVEIHIAPNYATSEQTDTQHDVIFLDGNNHLYLYFELGMGRLVLKTGSYSLSGPPVGTMTWSREAELVIRVKTSPAGRELSLTGASSGNFQVIDMLDKPTPANLPALYILGNANGAQECADLRYLGFFPPL
jgi:hypothetical protein